MKLIIDVSIYWYVPKNILYLYIWYIYWNIDYINKLYNFILDKDVQLFII